MTTITKLFAREILDSRGNPTIEAEITLNNIITATSSIPSGASTGSKEALELRDNDHKRFLGRGVLKAVSNVNTVISNSITTNRYTQEELDNFLIQLDGSPNKENLGANAVLSVSLAFAKAYALLNNKKLYQNLSWKKPKLPTPYVNIINGGAHADNQLAIQEFMIVPLGMENFKHQIQATSEIFHNLKIILKKHGFNTNVGDEGGFAPQLHSANQALDLIMLAIDKAGYSNKIKIALDSAANEFYQNKVYKVDNNIFSSDQLISYYNNLINQYPICSLEDPVAENDIIGWKNITTELTNKVQLVGDDLFVTNSKIFEEYISQNMANCILIKPNQIGTVTETIATIKLAEKNNYKAIVSHRSGETEDTFISHLAVASGCGMIKTGSMSRTDRICKYNELLRISEDFSN